MLITIIGCGGVGSIIARQLALGHTLHMIDFDKYEPKNAFRQPLAKIFMGEHKSAAHAEHLQEGIYHEERRDAHTFSIEPLMKDSKIPISEIIICAVDNNAGRNAAREISLKTGTPLIIAANEQYDGEASLFMPQWKGTKLDPWVTWPQLYDETAEDEANKPISCTDPRIATTEPQTPIANFMAAALAIWIAEKFAAIKGEIEFYDPIRASFTANMLRSKRPYDLMTEDEWKEIDNEPS